MPKRIDQAVYCDKRGTCAEVFGPKYESRLTEMQDWATHVGLI